MNPKSTDLYCHRNGWTGQEIHDDLVVTLGEEIITYNVVTWYFREMRINHSIATPLSDTVSSYFDESNDVILQNLEEFSFFSVRKLDRATHLSITMVSRTLSEKFVFAAHHFYWVSHHLSDDRKAINVQCFQSFSMILHTKQARTWHDMTLHDITCHYMSL
jgi:hypothetical protein